MILNLIAGLVRVIANRCRFILKRITGIKVFCKGKCTSRLDNEWSISKKASLKIGYHFASLRGCRFLVRDNGELNIGDNVGINSNCIVACHEKITIGKGTEIGPNVCIYDHDHDYRCVGGIKTGKYLSSPVIIGKNVWIGANVVILRGTEIGDNSVIAAGCIVKENVPPNTLLYAEKRNIYKTIGV